METDTWWGIVDRARAAVGDRADDRDSADDPLPDALVDALAALPPEQIAEFAVTHVEVKDSAYRHELWNAAYLIEGGCGDDGFMDFRDGLILLGRDVFTRAVADPDSLADLPVVARMGGDGKGWIGYEAVGYRVADAYRRVKGETDTLDAVLEDALRAMDRPDEPAGENWDPEDEEETRRRLPRLAGLFAE
ncbi:DUF4240 domain-containing protein [Actinosynnema sp. NPDC050436]|uniref:DUF4240 domain-containing protein n=1 Tax=Actinosynnema sp. NPDC050436 TaxID=3155659 RepID=UPI0034025707